jgi:hypothetical protein
MRVSTRINVLFGGILAAYVVGATVTVLAFEFHGGPGNSLGQQADNLSREAARDSADRAEQGR